MKSIATRLVATTSSGRGRGQEPLQRRLDQDAQRPALLPTVPPELLDQGDRELDREDDLRRRDHLCPARARLLGVAASLALGNLEAPGQVPRHFGDRPPRSQQGCGGVDAPSLLSGRPALSRRHDRYILPYLAPHGSPKTGRRARKANLELEPAICGDTVRIFIGP